MHKSSGASPGDALTGGEAPPGVQIDLAAVMVVTPKHFAGYGLVVH